MYLVEQKVKWKHARYLQRAVSTVPAQVYCLKKKSRSKEYLVFNKRSPKLVLLDA